MQNDNSKTQKAINKVVAYLQENNQRAYATAVQNAAGRVLTYESGEMRVGNYNKKINRWLTESLFLMNSDPNCPPQVIKITRKLIENYRGMNGMSTDDFLTDAGDLVVDIDKECGFDTAMQRAEIDELDDDETILQNTEVGEEYVVNDIIDFFAQAQSANAAERISVEEQVMSSLKHLVELGYFEVLERDMYNGRIQEVVRVH